MTFNGKIDGYLNTGVDHYVQKYPYHRLMWIAPEDFKEWRARGATRVYRDPEEPAKQTHFGERRRSATHKVETRDLWLIKMRPWRYWWYHLRPVRKRNKAIQKAIHPARASRFEQAGSWPLFLWKSVYKSALTYYLFKSIYWVRNLKISRLAANNLRRIRWWWLGRRREVTPTVYAPAPDEYFEENKQAMLDVGFDFEKAEAEWNADPFHKSVRDE